MFFFKKISACVIIHLLEKIKTSLMLRSLLFYIFQPNHSENLLQFLYQYHINTI